MKFRYIFYLLILSVIYPVKANVPVLKDVEGWVVDTISSGQIWYLYKGRYAPYNSNQIVNVTEIDLNKPEYKVEFKYVPSDTLSHVASTVPNAVAGINGTYLEIVDGKSTSFFRSNGENNRTVEISPDNMYFWKHEGAFYYDKQLSATGIEYGDNTKYLNWQYSNLLSGSPVLIDNFESVGETFVKNYDNIMQLPDEHPDKHQGIRHPRTAVALTSDNKLLLIVVDGRRSESAGMNAKELTQFVARYFAPKSCLNIDGGGSSTMWIKGSGLSTTDVVNYPTDNNRFDHYGQRRHRNFLVVTRTESGFSNGSGTESDPYIISTPDQLMAMHTVNWEVNQEPHFKLVNDLDMQGLEWIPLNSASPYSKSVHFDGNGHIIRNLSCKNQPYASLFGVLCGTCKNLGLLDVDINSTNGAGAFGGFVGIVSPTSASQVGVIDNCFSSGRIEGVAGVGGITGNIGKPYAGVAPKVRNCYSTADVVARYSSSSPQAGGARAGGVTGIVWTGGELINSYSTSKVIASNLFGVGGLVGYADNGIEGCIAMNDSLINSVSQGSFNAKIAHAIAYAHTVNVQPKCKNVWSGDEIVMMVAGNKISSADFSTPSYSFHGLIKPNSTINVYEIFFQLGWDFVSDENVWAETPSNGFPVFQWMQNRGDVNLIDGHKKKSPVSTPSLEDDSEIKCYSANKKIFVSAISEISSVGIYSLTGQMEYTVSPKSLNTVIDLTLSGIKIVRIKTNKGLKIMKISL